MRCAVVGAGAWGLPAAAELARRGHEVVLLDRYGPGHQLGSSSGPTRLWRLSHPDAVRTRLALRSVEAWQRLETDAAVSVLLRRGLLWRDDVSAGAVAAALDEVGVPYTSVDPGDVGRFFPGLRPDGRPAVWQATAGPVLARVALDAQAALFAAAGGRIVVGAVVRDVEVTGGGVLLRDDAGATVEADLVVLAPGPGIAALLPQLGVELAVRPVLEQVVHVGRGSATLDLPCLYDGPQGAEPGMYAMPTPGRGFKVGLDLPLRDWAEDDLDRTPDAAVSAAVSARVARDLRGVDPGVIDAQVCSWTESPDGRFVLDVVADGRVVLAFGDSGEGFKFSALMGPVLADLAEGRVPDRDVATFSLARFADGAGLSTSAYPHVLGR